MAKIRNEDFLFTTGRIRSLERELLGRERMERMIDAKTDEDALKILYDGGYQELLAAEPSLEKALSRFRRELYESLETYIPVPAVLDVFRFKYDFHNIKTAVKAAARNSDQGAAALCPGREKPGSFPGNQRSDCLRRRHTGAHGRSPAC